MISRKTEWYLVVILCLAALGTSWIVRGPAQADGLAHIYVLDIGQGDAIFIQGPDGRQMLIDGGPSGSRVLDELGAVMPAGDHTIDAILATHTDADHLTGLVDVLGRYEVAHIFETGMLCVTATCTKWEEAATAEGAVREQPTQGYRIVFADDFYFDVLNPETSVAGQKLSKTNNGGIVLKMTYGKETALFTGDIEKTVEDRLLRQGALLDVDILKVGHHGSKTSTSDAFLAAASPHVALISVAAKNSYGHPSPEVIGRLASFPELRYYRTDIHGRIELTLAKENYAIKTKTQSR